VDNSWHLLTTHPNVDSLRAGGFSTSPAPRVALDVVQAFFTIDLQESEGNWVKITGCQGYKPTSLESFLR